MGFLEILTLVFVALKAFGVIAWSWWAVFIPMYIAVGIYVIALVIWAVGIRAGYKALKRMNRDED